RTRTMASSLYSGVYFFRVCLVIGHLDVLRYYPLNLVSGLIRPLHITAKDTLTVISGNDTTISGANLLASNLDMNVGNNLHAESLQDTGSVDGKRWDASGSITIGAGVSGGASVGYGETDGSRAWVTEQTSLIGTESVNIKVGNHTQVDGALIANVKDDGTDGGNLNLDTRTL